MTSRKDETDSTDVSEYWFRIVRYYFVNWARIPQQEKGSGVIEVFLFDETAGVYEKRLFDRLPDTEQWLYREGFSRFTGDKEAQAFISPPKYPLHTVESPIWKSDDSVIQNFGDEFTRRRLWNSQGAWRKRRMKDQERVKDRGASLEVSGATNSGPSEVDFLRFLRKPTMAMVLCTDCDMPSLPGQTKCARHIR